MDFSLTSRERLIKEAVREFMVGECDAAKTLDLATWLLEGTCQIQRDSFSSQPS